MTPLMAWSGGMSPGRAGSCCGVFACRFTTTFAGSPSSCVSLRWLLEELLHFLHAQFTLGNVVLCFLLASYLAVTRPVPGCCMRNTENEFSDRQ